MGKLSSGGKNFDLSAKWMLRAAALLSLIISVALFIIPQTVYLNIVGLFFGGTIICLILAEMCPD